MNSEREIQQYLEGTLKGQDLERFKSKIDQDEAFKKLFLQYQKAWQLIINQHRKLSFTTRLKEQVRLSGKAISPAKLNEEIEDYLIGNEIDSEEEENFKKILISIFNKKSRRNRSIGFVIALAAGILLLAGMPVAFIMDKDYRSQQLFERYFEPYPYFLNHRSLNSLDSIRDSKVMFLYNQSDYLGASEILEASGTNTNLDIIHGMYLAICLIELKKYTEASNILEKLLSQKQDLTYCQASWYLALTYLKMNKFSKSIAILRRIELDSCPHAKQAAEILEILK